MTSLSAHRARCLTRILSSLVLFAAISIGGSIGAWAPALAQTSGDVQYQYDELGRLTVVTYSNGTNVEYHYDAAGNRTTVLALPGAGDSVPVIGEGANLVDLFGWPVGEAPAGTAVVNGWATWTTFSNETRWVRLTGPGQSGTITAMETGQTEVDSNGGGTDNVNWFDIDPTKAYEHTIYFRKHDLTLQSIYFGPHKWWTEYVSFATGTGAPTSNPYSLAWSTSTQAAVLDATKWYKIVSYVLPEGYPRVNNADWGGVYDVATGAKVANVNVFRWNPDRPDDRGQLRFFTYHDEATQGAYTAYFYRPEVRVVDCNLRPELCGYQYVTPNISTSHADAAEGGSITYTVSLSAATTVPVEVNYVVDHDGAGDSAEAGDYTAIPLTTLTIPEGTTSATITVSTVDNTIYEGDEAVRLTLSAPVRATIVVGQEVEKAYILDSADAPSFSIADVTNTEGTVLTFTVTRSGASDLSHNVTYSTAHNSTEPEDYTAASGTLTFASGDITKTISVTTTQDAAYEWQEQFYVNLSSATNGAEISDSQATGQINNDDSPPSFAINDMSASEGGIVTFTVAKTGATEVQHSVNYATATNTAGSGDFTAASGTLTFAAGDTSKTFMVTTTEDTSFENNETFYANLSNATSNATISDSQGIGTINNDDNAPGFTINDASILEGGNITFTVTLSAASSFTHSVNYATSSGTATSGTDFTAASNTLTFTPGQTSKTFTVTTTEDGLYENAETATATLSGVTGGATITDATGIGTINNDDMAPSFTINNVPSTEGNPYTFTVTKSGSTALSHSVNFATANGTAIAGSDYTTTSGTLTFAAGTTTQTIPVTVANDTVYESAETFFVNLSAATSGATISDSQGQATINNNDTAPSFTVNNVSASEGTNVVFTVTKSGSTALSHNVNYATANNTGVAGSDYTTKSGTLIFAAGTSTATVTVTSLNDSIYESTESFYLNLSLATNGATIADSQGVGTITDNDTAPSFSISNVSGQEGNNLTFTVTKSGSTAFSHNVSYATANGTATAGSDYTSKSGTLTFAAGTSSTSVTVTTIEDSIREGDKTFYLNLSSATNGATISDNQGLGTILEDDPLAVNDTGSMPIYDNNNFTVLGNDSDPNGDPLTITSLVNPLGPSIFGQISCSNTCIQVDAIASGTYSITYTISDGNGGSDSALLTITVTSGGGGGGGGGPFN